MFVSEHLLEIFHGHTIDLLSNFKISNGIDTSFIIDNIQIVINNKSVLFIMKTLLAFITTFISLLAIGAISDINYDNNNKDISYVEKVFAQIDPEEVQRMESTDVSESDTIGISNESEPVKMNWTGTIDVHDTIGEAFKSKINVNIIDAITTAQNSIGPNSFAKEAELTEAHNYLIYKVKVVDEEMKKYKVGVDPGTGEVLFKKEMTWYDEHKEKYGDGKGDKYSYKNKMMKDRNY
ncbi:MAG: PepSY domain-containing protein [Nitrososphaeraceae archaeon]